MPGPPRSPGTARARRRRRGGATARRRRKRGGARRAQSAGDRRRVSSPRLEGDGAAREARAEMSAYKHAPATAARAPVSETTRVVAAKLAGSGGDGAKQCTASGVPSLAKGRRVSARRAEDGGAAHRAACAACVASATRTTPSVDSEYTRPCASQLTSPPAKGGCTHAVAGHGRGPSGAQLMVTRLALQPPLVKHSSLTNYRRARFRPTVSAAREMHSAWRRQCHLSSLSTRHILPLLPSQLQLRTAELTPVAAGGVLVDSPLHSPYESAVGLHVGHVDATCQFVWVRVSPFGVPVPVARPVPACVRPCPFVPACER